MGHMKPGMRVLEPMCGSGRILIPLAERGVHIEGFDMSESMLTACRVKLEQKGLTARVVLSDFVHFQPEGLYDFILIPAGSFSLLTDEEEARVAIVQMSTWLAPGWILLLVVETKDASQGMESAESAAQSVYTA